MFPFALALSAPGGAMLVGYAGADGGQPVPTFGSLGAQQNDYVLWVGSTPPGGFSGPPTSKIELVSYKILTPSDLSASYSSSSRYMFAIYRGIGSAQNRPSSGFVKSSAYAGLFILSDSRFPPSTLTVPYGARLLIANGVNSYDLSGNSQPYMDGTSPAPGPANFDVYELLKP